MSNEEDLFIRKALASVDKAEQYSRVKQIVVSVLAIGGVFWLTERSPGQPLRLEPVLMGVGLIAGVCTAKLKTLINRNTKAVLQAISDLHRG
jgi:hypothetical protein